MFYSKVNDLNTFPPGWAADVEFDFELSLPHDDGYIIYKLVGPSKPEYQIEYHANNGSFICFEIQYAQGRSKEFWDTDLTDLIEY